MLVDLLMNAKELVISLYLIRTDAICLPPYARLDWAEDFTTRSSWVVALWWSSWPIF